MLRSNGASFTNALSAGFNGQGSPTTGVELADVDADGLLDAVFWTKDFVREKSW